MRFSLISILLVFFISSGCQPVPKEAASIQLGSYTIDDLEYPNSGLQISDSLTKTFAEKFFLPWKLPPQHLVDSLETFPGKEPNYLHKYLEDDEWYGENKKPHIKWQREEIVNNADLKSFPNFLKKGIVVSHTDLRRIPTKRPGFDTYSEAGEGYPFDYFQETSLWANTPLLLVHISKDKQWCYVVSPYYKGWVSMRDLALTDADFIAQWSTGNFGMPLSDHLSLQNSLSNYAVNAKMGMLLPFEEISNTPDKVSVYFASSDENQQAHILKAEVDRAELAMPNFEFNEDNLKPLVANLVGRPYGWGGNLENRDCSSLIRDLLGTFRLWLPRDSKDQMTVGHKYDFPETADEKIRLIKEKGVPFLSILRKKGHNMLYVGEAPDGEPLVLHAFWGLKTSYSNEQLAEYLKKYPIEGIHQDQEGVLRGRYIIGETIITSVNLGAGNQEGADSLIDEMYAMTNLLEN